jgi:hypothetical protein
MEKLNKGRRKISRRDFAFGTMLSAIGGSVASSSSQTQAEQSSLSYQGAPPEVGAPAGPLVPWVFVHQPLEHWLSNYQSTFDAWADGGVRGILVGRLSFEQQVPESGALKHGASLPTFAADPKVYKSFGVTPPADVPRDPMKEKQLQVMLDNAASRGWEILLFGLDLWHGGSRPAEEDPFDAVSFAACVQDTLNAFPQAHAVVMDGCGREQSYELPFHHGGECFEIREEEKRRLAILGRDVGRMERGMTHLRDRFHHLDPSMVRYYSPGGMLGGLALFDLDEDALYWLRTRQETMLQFSVAIRHQLERLNRKIRLGGIPRAAAFSFLTAQDYHKIGPYFDYIFPKHYFWNRGFDGMYGTIARWVRQIADWNPGLSERDCFAVVKSWLGLELPGIHTLDDIDSVGFPDEFFSEVVYSETRRALEGVGDDKKVIAWVSTGRHPHAGDPMSAHDLYRILVASQRAGLKRFVYHPDPDLGAAEWGVISKLCGKRWKEDPSSSYWPSDTGKPDTYNGGRKPKNRQ